MPLLLDERAVSSLLRMEELIALMEQTLAAFSRGQAQQPVRTVLAFAEHDSMLGVMPGYLSESGALGVKIVSLAPKNAERGIPTHLATILLLDPVTGQLLAIMDGRLITEMRTAAVSAAAAGKLAQPQASQLAILGSGVQAASHLEAFRLVRKLAPVRVWSPTKARRERFASEQSERWGLRVEAVASAEAALRGANLIVTATSSRTPILRGDWLAPGTHMTSVGACRPDWRELDGEAVRRSRVFVDSAAAAKVEAGDLILAQMEGEVRADHVIGEIGAVFAGNIQGRTREDQITLFKSLGLAVEDAATAQLAYRLALERGVGEQITL